MGVQVVMNFSGVDCMYFASTVLYSVNKNGSRAGEGRIQELHSVGFINISTPSWWYTHDNFGLDAS